MPLFSTKGDEKSPVTSARKSISNFLRKSLSFTKSDEKKSKNNDQVSIESVESLQAHLKDLEDKGEIDFNNEEQHTKPSVPPGSPKDGGLLLSILSTQKKRYSAKMNSSIVIQPEAKDNPELAQLLYTLILNGEEEQFKQILTKEELAKYNNDIDSMFRYQEKMTLMHLAAKHDRAEILTHLYGLGAFLESHDANNATPLFYSVANSCSKASVFLLSKGVTADCKDSTGTTPFLIALRNGDFDMMELLLMFNIDINAKGLRGNTALHIACAEGNSNKVKFLLDRNAHPTRTNARGQTPLACALASIMVLRELIEHMENNNVPLIKYLGMKDEQGATLMHHCVENGFIDSANYLLEYLQEKCGSVASPVIGSSKDNGKDINNSSSSSYNPIASILNEKELLQGNTVLHLAVKLKRENFVQLFVTYVSYFDVNIQNKAGNTALHLAVILKFEDIAKVLVSKGHANVKLKNNKKETPTQLAKEHGVKLEEENISAKRKSLFSFFSKG